MCHNILLDNSIIQIYYIHHALGATEQRHVHEIRIERQQFISTYSIDIAGNHVVGQKSTTSQGR